jgi:hypothetical protein
LYGENFDNVEEVGVRVDLQRRQDPTLAPLANPTAPKNREASVRGRHHRYLWIRKGVEAVLCKDRSEAQPTLARLHRGFLIGYGR